MDIFLFSSFHIFFHFSLYYFLFILKRISFFFFDHIISIFITFSKDMEIIIIFYDNVNTIFVVANMLFY